MKNQYRESALILVLVVGAIALAGISVWAKREWQKQIVREVLEEQKAK